MIASIGLVVTVVVIISFKKGRLSLLDKKKQAEQQDRHIETLVKELDIEPDTDQLVAMKNQERENELLRNMGLLPEEQTEKPKRKRNKKEK